MEHSPVRSYELEKDKLLYIGGFGRSDLFLVKHKRIAQSADGFVVVLTY